MSMDKMCEDVLALVQAEVAQQVSEGKHKLNAKHTAAAHTINTLRAQLKGAREEFDAQKRRARDAEARNGGLETLVAALKAELAPEPPADEGKATAVIKPMAVLAAVAAKGAK